MLLTSFTLILLNSGCESPVGGQTVVDENFHPGLPGDPQGPNTFPSIVLSSTASAFTSTSPIPVTVTFSESVTGFVVGDLTLGNGTASNFSGSGATYTFNLTPAGQGSVTVDVFANRAVGAGGNPNIAAVQMTRVYDTVPPAVVISSTASPVTSASPIPVTITFNESVSGFAVGDLTLGNGTASNFSGSGTTYTFDLTPSGQGAVTVDLAANVANDAAGNPNTGAAQLTRTYDSVAPTVVLSSTAPANTSTSPIPVTVTFSKSVTGFVVGDLTLGNGTASNFSGSGTTYNFDLTPSAQGPVTVDIVANIANDAAGNGNTAATQLTRTYDSLAPAVTLSSIAPAITSTSPIPVTVTFSKSVTGFVIGDLTLGNGTASNFSGSGTTYTFDLTPSGQGAVTADVAANKATDGAGNPNTASNQLTRTYDTVAPTVVLSSIASASTSISPIPVTVTFSKSVTGFVVGDLTLGNGTASNFSGSGTTYTFDLTPSGQGAVTVNLAANRADDAAGNGNTAATQLARTYDTVAPTVVLSSTASASTSTSPIPVTVTFSKSVTGVVVGDLALGNGTASNFSGSGTTYTFDLTPSGQGAVTVDLAANKATDAAGNVNTTATQLVRTYDTVAPTVALFSLAPTITATSPIPVTVTFSKSVTGFVVGDLTFGNGTASNFSGSGTSYAFDLTPSGQGAVTVDIAAGKASDGAGNVNTAATQFTRTYDTDSPTVALFSLAPAVTATSPIPVTVTFNESVTDFVVGDLTLGNGTASNFSGSGTSYAFDLTPSGQGGVTVDVAANVAKDEAGNPNTAAAQITRTYDTVAPTLLISSPTTASINSGNNNTYTVTYSGADAVTLASGDITLNKTGASDCASSSITGAGTTTRTVTLNNCTGGGTIGISIAASSASDTAGNQAIAAGPSTAFTVITLPAAPTAWALSSPSNGMASGDATPVVSASSSNNGAIVKLWVNDATCAAGTVLGSQTVASGAFTFNGLTMSGYGLKTFYYTTEFSGGSPTACASTGLNYTYQLPIYTLSRNSFSMLEDGTAIGSLVTVTRDIDGVAGTVVLKASSVSAQLGAGLDANPASGAITVNFAAGDVSKSVSAASWAINDDAITEGDEYFRIRMTASSGGTTDSMSIINAAVNILDNELTGDYFFPSPLVSAAENGTSITLIAQRTTTVGAAWVDVEFLGGTAANTTDYAYSSNRFNFAAGNDEATLTVTLNDNSTQGDSKSFYLRMNSFSLGTKSRAWGVTKVRILDDDDTTVCDPTNNITGVNLGFGGVSSGKYLICSLPQLWKMRNNPTLEYQLMADIDADPSIDANTAAGGTQPFVGPGAVAMTKSFWGNERVIYNYTYTGTGAGDTTGAVFSKAEMGSPSNTYDGINILYGKITTTGSQQGFINNFSGNTVAFEPKYQNILVSGYLKSAGNSKGMLVGQVNHPAALAGAKTTFTNIVSHGSLEETAIAYSVGGVLGNAVTNVSQPIKFIRNHNLTNILQLNAGANFNYGGIFGFITSNASGNATVTISDSENRGLMWVLATRVGGILPYITNSHFYNLSVDNNRNYGNITCDSYCAGILATFNAPISKTLSITDSINRGEITSTKTTAIVGGILAGYIQGAVTGGAVELTGNQNIGSITNQGTSGSSATGGILGSIITTNSKALNFDFGTAIAPNSNLGSVSVAGGAVGGMVGLFDLGMTNASSKFMDFYGNSNSGSITGTGNATTGGLYGSFSSDAASGKTLTATFSGETNSGTVTGGSDSTGGIFGFLDAGAYCFLNIDTSVAASSNTGSVTCAGNNCGGLLGRASTSARGVLSIDGASTSTSATVNSAGNSSGGFAGLIYASGTSSSLTITNSYAKGSVASSGDNSGGFVGAVAGVGANTVTLQKNYATGSLSGTGGVKGGFFGSLNQSDALTTFTLNRNYSRGNVSGGAIVGAFGGAVDHTSGGPTVVISNSFTAGGLVSADSIGGLFLGQVAGTGVLSLTKSYSLSEFAGALPFNPGGLIGSGTATNTADSYWLKDAAYNTGVTRDFGDSAGLTQNRTDLQLQSQATFVGWSFYNSVSNTGGLWFVPGANSSNYPTLRNASP